MEQKRPADIFQELLDYLWNGLGLEVSSTIAGEGRKVLWHVICMIMNGMFRKRQEWK